MTTVVRRAVPDDLAVPIDLVAEYCLADTSIWLSKELT